MSVESIELLTIGQVAKAIRVTDSTIYKWCQSGKLPHFRFDNGKRGAVRIRLDDVREFLDRNRVNGGLEG